MIIALYTKCKEFNSEKIYFRPQIQVLPRIGHWHVGSSMRYIVDHQSDELWEEKESRFNAL